MKEAQSDRSNLPAQSHTTYVDDNSAEDEGGFVVSEEEWNALQNEVKQLREEIEQLKREEG
ncbi:hypothetical protein L6470_06930 [Prevotella communis]|uniref:hypothetical protein n=1 Tax=Prevotella communis TaxID=2913614 RepID=UPI001EDA2CC2|nr:hypothetical protein [Prevotella communis]UKK58125.1 hypothetical protein L6470_06930 [Prevotella communis]